MLAAGPFAGHSALTEMVFAPSPVPGCLGSEHVAHPCRTWLRSARDPPRPAVRNCAGNCRRSARTGDSRPSPPCSWRFSPLITRLLPTSFTSTSFSSRPGNSAVISKNFPSRPHLPPASGWGRPARGAVSRPWRLKGRCQGRSNSSKSRSTCRRRVSKGRHGSCGAAGTFFSSVLTAGLFEASFISQTPVEAREDQSAFSVLPAGRLKFDSDQPRSTLRASFSVASSQPATRRRRSEALLEPVPESEGKIGNRLIPARI